MGIPVAKVYRVDPSKANLADPTQTPMTEWATGLWPINGCAFGPNGALYVSQLVTQADPTFTNPHGDVVKIQWAHPSRHISLTSCPAQRGIQAINDHSDQHGGRPNRSG